MRLAGLLGIPLLLMLAKAATAQVAPGTGSLTIQSRPGGAAWELVGPQRIVGHTPVTLRRGLIGRFTISGTYPGCERWSGTIELDGARADTVWMAFKAKSRLLAAGRSLIIPGWGQAYAERPGRAWFWLIAGVGSATAFGHAAMEYSDDEDRLNAAHALLEAADTPAEEALAQAAVDAAQLELDDTLERRRVTTAVMAGVWGLAALDAAIVLKPPSAGGTSVSLRLEPRVHAGRAEMLAAARVRF